MNVFRPPGSSTLPRFRPVNTRRRARNVALVLAGCVTLGLIAWQFGVKSEDDFSTECERDDYVALTPDPTAVHVYNSTQIIGLGQSVAQQLRDRNFTVGEIANDPLRRKIRGTGELRYSGTAAEHNVEALRSWQPGMVVVKEDRPGRGPSEVDFVMGVKFDKLNDKAEPPPGTPQTACKPGTGES